MSQILTLTDISYCYPGAPEPLFEHLSATFAAGWAAVLGDNGIGKTTLAKLACGMLSPDSGTVSPNPCKMAVAYCPQRTDETPTNLDDFAADWTGETIAIRDALNIGDDWAYRYETLSGGEAKRLQIACALAGDPDVLVLDEPTNHVDGRTRQAITQAMRRFDGIGIVISHDVELIDATCSRCVMLERRHAGIVGPSESLDISPQFRQLDNAPVRCWGSRRYMNRLIQELDEQRIFLRSHRRDCDGRRNMSHVRLHVKFFAMCSRHNRSCHTGVLLLGHCHRYSFIRKGMRLADIQVLRRNVNS